MAQGQSLGTRTQAPVPPLCANTEVALGSPDAPYITAELQSSCVQEKP